VTTRREKLLEMLKSSPDDSFLVYGLAMEDRAAGDLPAALRGLQKVLELDPDYLAAWFHQGQILAEVGEHDRAREILARGIDVARRVGDQHALEEMTGFLQELE
jgi:predicted Zn-dependent protease